MFVNADQLTVDDLGQRNIEVINLAAAEKADYSTVLGNFLDELADAVVRRRSSEKRPLVGLSSSPELQRSIEDYLIRAMDRYETRMTQAVSPHGKPEDPYRGLLPFGIEHADIFFGRKDAIKTLHCCLLRDRLTVLQADSGTGKTSLLNAGLAPLLIREGRLPVYINTYQDLKFNIKRVLAPSSDEPWPEPLSAMSLQDFLGSVCRQLKPPNAELLLVLDQFEDLFREWPERQKRQPFIDALAQCYYDKALPIRIVIAIRKDHFADLADLQGSLPSVFDNVYRLEPMSRQEAEEAILQPVKSLTSPVEYESGLVDALLDDLARDGMELPHLQIICSRLYDSLAEGQTVISLSEYQRLDGAPGILGGYLNDVLERLPKDLSVIAKRVLMVLVSSAQTQQTLTEESLAIRVRVEQERIRPVLVNLVRARLMQRSQVEGEIRYGMLQDYLVKRVKLWLDEEDPARRDVQELLQREVDTWREFRTQIPVDKLEILYKHREHMLDLDADARDCLLASVLAEPDFAVKDWLEVMGGSASIQQSLARLATSDDLSVPIRVAAADELGLRGDIRPGVGLTEDRLPDIIWCTVPKGEFVMGEGVRQHVHSMDKEFEISRYPVTNAQYDAFVLDGGYTDRWQYCWTEDGWRWKSDRTGPRKLGGRFDLPNHPVVGVSCHEAVAFCNWLSEKLGRSISLPSEAQWEMAARGPDGRRYPWGHGISPDHANYRETAIRTTTAVGIFPKGVSPYGVLDMSGNAWEWCATSQCAESRVQYALRGGCFDLGEDFLRCAYRIRSLMFKNSAIGFRVVSSL